MQRTYVSANENYQVKDSICKHVAYVLKGSLYQFHQNDNLDEEISALYAPGDWVLDKESFLSQKASPRQIRAMQNSVLLTLHMDDIHDLIGQNPALFKLGKLLEAGDNFSASKDPRARYTRLLNDRPDYLQLFPLKMIASYLGMTPETLSRVRKDISIS